SEFTGSVTVTFTATDECGNATPTTAIFTITDDVAPLITNEAEDMTVDCDGSGNTSAFNDWLNSHGGMTATDDCSELTWSTNPANPTLSDLCGASGSVTVEFIATDACGNESISTATFTIEDVTAPSISTQAADLTVDCDGSGNTA